MTALCMVTANITRADCANDFRICLADASIVDAGCVAVGLVVCLLFPPTYPICAAGVGIGCNGAYVTAVAVCAFNQSQCHDPS
jgi:hypothetical protein